MGIRVQKFEWHGEKVIADAAEAARRGINEVAKAGANLARVDHEWVSRTGATESSIFQEEAKILDGDRYVQGKWGVRAQPRFRPNGELQNESTVDVAFFLEFGTGDRESHPFIYPAWDETKHELGAAIRVQYAAIQAGTGTFVKEVVEDFSFGLSDEIDTGWWLE